MSTSSLLGQNLAINCSIFIRVSYLCSASEESTCNAVDPSLIPGLGTSPREENGNPLQYSHLKIPCTEKPDGLQSMGSQKAGDTTEQLST